MTVYLTYGLTPREAASLVRRHARAWCDHLGLDYDLLFLATDTSGVGLSPGWRDRGRRLIYAALHEQGHDDADITAAFGINARRAVPREDAA